MVLISADDPGMHSSQDEQDNRYCGETFDTPVILYTTTRVNHSQSMVEQEGEAEVILSFERIALFYAMHW
ncbi:MAG: hypothetical protein ACYDG6_06365 [Thermincolia bacterium]